MADVITTYSAAGTGGKPYDKMSKRERALLQQQALLLDRTSWDEMYTSLAELLQPRSINTIRNSIRTNDGGNVFNKIYDSSGLRARRILLAGLSSGLTSPARQWHRYVLQDRKLMERKPVAMWLKRLTDVVTDVLRSSNAYRALPVVYGDLASFGTAATFLEEDFNDIVRFYPSPVGEYVIAQNDRNTVDTIIRQLHMPVKSVVQKFGLGSVSQTVKRLWDAGNVHTRVPVVHSVAPNEYRDRSRKDAKNMAFASCWFELAADNTDQLLRESGYKRFPALVPRWTRTGNDVYGDSPGMEALGDLRQLMHEQLRKAQGLDYQTNPPLQVPTAYKDKEVERFPGGIIFTDPASPGAAVKSAFEVQLRVDHLAADIEQVTQRINQSFYVDLFLMMAQIDRSNVTAREIAEKHEEKLLMLGPVLEALDDELLGPMMDFILQRVFETGIMPPPPPELQGQELSVEFIGTLAQAQRAVGIGAIDRVVGTIASLAQLKPETLDKLNADQVIDDISGMLGINPELIIGDDKVAIVRQQRQEAQQAQQAMANMKPAADIAKTMSETDLDKPSALNDDSTAAG